MNGDTIYHLHFLSGGDFYFGSIAAIYEMFSGKDIGAAAQRLYETVDFDKPYSNKKCTVNKGVIHRKQGGRGKVKQVRRINING